MYINFVTINVYVDVHANTSIRKYVYMYNVDATLDLGIYDVVRLITTCKGSRPSCTAVYMLLIDKHVRINLNMKLQTATILAVG